MQWLMSCCYALRRLSESGCGGRVGGVGEGIIWDRDVMLEGMIVCGGAGGG